MRFAKPAKLVFSAVLVAAFVLLGLLFSAHTPIYNPYGSGAGGEIRFARAMVVSIGEQSITPSSFPGLYTGRQIAQVRVLDGVYKGRQFELYNALNYDSNYVLHNGQNVVVSLNASTGGKTLVTCYLYAPGRALPLLLLLGLFAAALCLVGGRRGFYSLLGLVFTVASVALYFIPLLYRGVPPVAATMLLAAVCACVTLFLVGGWNRKSLCAVLGTVAGVAVSVLLLLLFGGALQVSGYTSSDTDALLNIAGQCRLQVKDLLFSGVVISSLGAVMDIAISIASTLSELHAQNPGAGFRELFRSGMNVGRDMMGTMTNTLILAYLGSSLFALILMYSYQVQPLQLLNSSSIAIDLLEAACGSFAVILAVPLTSLLASRLLPGEPAAASEARSLTEAAR